MPTFHNPYNFVPVVPRPADGHPLADTTPAWHDRLHHDLWSGRIAVTMTTKTPLLLPEPVLPEDPAYGGLPESEAGHQFFRTAVRANDAGKYVYVAGSAVKGMLRATYEAITNSRLSVFQTRGRLGFRYDDTYAQRLFPAVLCASTGGVVLLPGLRVNGHNAMGAARIHRYNSANEEDGTETALWTTARIRHGQKLEAWLEFHGDGSGIGSWHVVTCRPHGESSRFPPPPNSGKWPIRALVHGYVHAVNRGTAMKEHERLFITRLCKVMAPGNVRVEAAPPVTLGPDQLRPNLIKDYEALIEHYRSQHTAAFGARDDIWDRNYADNQPRKPDGSRVRPWDYLSADPNRTSWSRHLYDVRPRREKGQDELTEAEIRGQGPDTLPLGAATTCFAELELLRSGKPPSTDDLTLARCVRLVPVQIPRALPEQAPHELLHEHTEPAQALTDLSPADRVFGWVAQQSLDTPDEGAAADSATTVDDGRDRAWASRLRIGSVRCAIPVGQALFVPRVPVALDILGAPKPSQGRFYVGQEGANGVPIPLDRRVEKETFFSENATPRRRLRGRKVYPHHRHAAGKANYWNADENGRAEYRRPGNTRDNQNHSMLDWVKPGVSFTFTVDVRNMTDAELGALLWILDPQRLGADGEPGHLRLGHGKPFGFGSVSLELDPDGTDLRRGSGWARDIAAFGNAEQTDDWADLVDRFEGAIASIRGGSAVVQAVRRAAAGYSDGVPIHYPRKECTKDPDGKNYEWFVANEQRDRTTKKLFEGHSLPELGPARPPTLPLLKPRDEKGRRRR